MESIKIRIDLKFLNTLFDIFLNRYSTLPPGHTGIESLTQKLTKILYTHIRRFLP